MEYLSKHVSLNFNDKIIGKSWIDKDGLEITIGFISGLPIEIAEIAYPSGDMGISVIDKGYGQKELDIACESLIEQCAARDITILITKSDLPFDARWYLIGQLDVLLKDAMNEHIKMPFRASLADDILSQLARYNRSIEY